MRERLDKAHFVQGKSFSERNTNNSEGKKYDQGKQDWTLLPWASIRQVVAVLDFGAIKYAPNAWMNVPDARRRYMSAAYRHMTAVSEGEWLDSESNLPHIAHAACCMLFMLWFGKEEK